MSVKITFEDYKKKYGIKSNKTVYNHIKKGIIEKVEDESGNVFIIENSECNVNYTDTLQLQNELQKLHNEVKLLKFQLENKDKFINHLEEQIKQQYNQINALNYQLLEIGKSNVLLLENKKDNKEKRWYQFWK